MSSVGICISVLDGCADDVWVAAYTSVLEMGLVVCIQGLGGEWLGSKWNNSGDDEIVEWFGRDPNEGCAGLPVC